MTEGELFAFLEGTSDAAFTVDEDGAIRSWNSAAEKLFGYTCAEVLTRTCRELLDAQGGFACTPRRAQHCAAGPASIPDFDLEVRAHSGRRIWVNVSTLLFRDPRHHCRLVVHLARDITRRKRTEELARRMLELSSELATLSDGKGQTAPAATPLSEQEQRILRLFSRGRNAAEIARQLGISLQTLRNHLYRINQKLRTHNRLEAVMCAMDRGLI
jgi:PAS domain S-box-containing protein